MNHPHLNDQISMEPYHIFLVIKSNLSKELYYLFQILRDDEFEKWVDFNLNKLEYWLTINLGILTT